MGLLTCITEAFLKVIYTGKIFFVEKFSDSLD